MTPCKHRYLIITLAIRQWYLYRYNYIAYAFSIITFMLSASLIYDVYKGPQIAIMRVKFQFQKVSNHINMTSTSFSLTIKGYSDKHY